MKTAVEWLEEMLTISLGEHHMSLFINEFNKAKKMEKEQKIEFACQVYDKYNFGTQEISFREECEQFKQQEQ